MGGITQPGLPIPGYRPQRDENLRLVTDFKNHEERLLRLLDALKDDAGLDQRWLAIGRTGLQQAFMAINRAVFQPQRHGLPEDATL